MDSWNGLIGGFGVVLSPEVLLAALLGAIIGTAIGVLPGLGPVGGAALVLPLTFTMEPITALVALGAIYYGAMYGGSTTSILLNMPGEASSVVTAIDGYEMTKKGRGGAALSIVAIGSFVAATLSITVLVFFAPALSEVALAFGPAEYLALTAGGLVLLATITGGGLFEPLLMVSFGLLLGTVGFDAVNGVERFTYGSDSLVLGFDMVPATVGLFGLAELFRLAERHLREPRPTLVRLRELLPSKHELRLAVPAWMRGAGLGAALGLLPGPSPTIGSFLAYRVEKGVSKHPETFGRGAPAGVAGPEAANNAAATTSFGPLLSLGLPFTPSLALIMAAMQIQGVQPGPLLISDHPDIFWGVIASMYIGNVMLLMLNLPMVSVWIRLLRIPIDILSVGIIVATIIGSYALRSNMFDVWVLLGFGVLGYVLNKCGISPVPLVLALVLGPVIEKHLLEGLYVGDGKISYFFDSPLAIVIWAVGVGGFLVPAAVRRLRVDRNSAVAVSEKEL